MRIEFFGPPGTGKTYLIEKLRNMDRETISKKATNPILLFLKKASRFSPISIKYKYQIKQIIKSKNLISKYHDTSLNSMIDSIVLVATAYKIKPKDDIVLDEGLVHRIISLGVNYNLPNESVIKIISLFQNLLLNRRVISITLEKTSIIESIKQRNRKISKMDFFEDGVLVDFIEHYIELCQVVTDHFNFEEITRDHFEEFVKENRN